MGLQVVNMTLQFLLICRVQCGEGRGHYISCTKQVSLTIFGQSFPAFSQTDSIVNSHTSDWACTTIGVPQRSLLSPFIFPDGLESEESILPIDLHLEELQ